MKTNIFIFTAFLLFMAGSFSACKENKQDSQVPDVNFTPCQQTKQAKAKNNSELSDVVDVEFTAQGVQIMYYGFEVTCDFNTVDVTYTFVNGFLNITQQGAPNQADCVCYTDVSYTIEGISQNEVNVIFINGVQVYCHNENNDDNFPIDIPFTEYSLAGTSCQWININMEYYGSNIVIINNNEELENYILCTDGDFPAIDFSIYSLLLIYGLEGHMVAPNYQSLQQLSEQNYIMNVNLFSGFGSVITKWQVVIIVDKIIESAYIELIVTKNY